MAKQPHPTIIALRKLLKDEPQAGLVDNRNKTVAFVINEHYQLKERCGLSSDIIVDMVSAVNATARELRQQTEGKQEEIKEILSQEAQIDLGYGN